MVRLGISAQGVGIRGHPCWLLYVFIRVQCLR
jgi:hypothetical protein